MDTDGEAERIGMIVERLRMAKGWSRSELARKSGLPPPTITRIEDGSRGANIRYSTLEALARALGVEPTTLQPATLPSAPATQDELRQLSEKVESLARTQETLEHALAHANDEIAQLVQRVARVENPAQDCPAAP